VGVGGGRGGQVGIGRGCERELKSAIGSEGEGEGGRGVRGREVRRSRRGGMG